jgi:hypothetical protein
MNIDMAIFPGVSRLASMRLSSNLPGDGEVGGGAGAQRGHRPPISGKLYLDVCFRWRHSQL